MANIRPAEPRDAALILTFIRDLAEYERLAHVVKASLGDIERLLFDPAPRAFCEIAEAGGRPVGFVLWFYTVSTFEGRHGIHLEDLYVISEARGSGVGRALMKSLAGRCVREDLARLEWAVLDWNTPEIAFYDGLGGGGLDHAAT